MHEVYKICFRTNTLLRWLFGFVARLCKIMKALFEINFAELRLLLGCTLMQFSRDMSKRALFEISESMLIW